jgi:hypothetical protein
LGTHREDEVRSTITSTTGGIMTEEVGTITGDLEVATRMGGAGEAEAAVRYVGANEWYTVEGSPIEVGKIGGLSPSELRELHEGIVERLTTPGKTVDGNEEPVSLQGFSP